MLSLFAALAVSSFADGPSPDVARLAEEVKGKGWIVFPARSEQRDWDLYLMRPDGSQRRPITRTPEWNEAWPQFSRDGSKLLYRRLRRDEEISGNRYGEQGVPVVANSDGTSSRELGEEGALPWATWSPDDREFATLSIKGVSLVDAETGRVRLKHPRRGFFQQVTWSPDGRSLVGVANSFGTGWSIARMDAGTGNVTAVNTVDCCTPDWFPDARGVVFSWRPPGQTANQGAGWTQLWRGNADGTGRQLIYAEDGRHVYGGHVSPDGTYVIFTGNVQEDGDPERGGAPMGLVRLSDTPMIGGDSRELRELHPDAKKGPVLTLPSGWEPSWTFSEKPADASSSRPDGRNE